MTSDDPKKVAKDTTERVGGALSDAAEAAKSGAAKSVDSVREFATRTSDAAGSMYGEASKRVRDAADRLPDPSDAVAAGRRAYDQGNRSVGRHVAKQPLEALLLAGAIGYLVGWAANRG